LCINFYIFFINLIGGLRMANADTPFGARLAGCLIGTTQNAQITAYTVPATDSTALFVGDFVKTTGTSAVGEDGVSRPIVTQAAATEALRGFVVGFFASSDNLNQIYRTASTLRTVYVCDDPFATFEIQTDGTMAITDISANADITVGTGSTVTGVSAIEIDQTTISATDGQLRLLTLAPRPDNEVGANAKLICMINEHELKQIAGT
jgi:hypothetical protein